jgi:hypothetical protein
MTTPRPIEPLDDDVLGAAVRDAADQWTMPAVRLDAPGWRDRIRTPRARRVAALRGAMGRLGQAAGAAVALTVAAAVLGVYLAGRDAGKPGGSPSATQRPGSSSVAASPLPKLLQAGPLGGPSSVLVSNEGTFQLLDLTTGNLVGTIGTGQYGAMGWVRADGGVGCLCIAGDGYSRNGSAVVTVSLLRSDSHGSALSTTVVGTYRGTPDPRDPISAQSPQDATVSISPGPVGGTAIVGWTVHAHPVWRSGLDVVDLASGAVVQHVAMPDRSDGDGTLRVAPVGPRPIGLTGDGDVVLDQGWFSWSPATAGGDFHFGSDAFTAHLAGTVLSDVRPFDVARACGTDIAEAGPRPAGRGTWLACVSPSTNQTRLRLIDQAGAVTDVQLQAGLGGSYEGSASDVSPDGRWLYLWNATRLVLTRVDLATGATTTATGASASATDLFTALGRWLVPTAAAKVILSPGLTVSPDGTRIYALGIDSTGAASDAVGSAGILVFDAASMRQVDRWPPTADFISIAVSADGSQVYAAGGPQVFSDGQQSNQPASVTIYDAATGEVRLIAGSLGQGYVTFPSTTVP